MHPRVAARQRADLPCIGHGHFAWMCRIAFGAGVVWVSPVVAAPLASMASTGQQLIASSKTAERLCTARYVTVLFVTSNAFT